MVLPDWLPDSMVLAEPMGQIMMRVEYRLTAQLVPFNVSDWVGDLPQMGVSLCRFEKPFFINRSANHEPEF